MRRGAKPGKAKVVAKRPRPRTSPKDEASKRHDLEKRLAEALEREAGAVKREAEARDQQTATSEILSVISRSQTDVQPVFDAIVQSALGLCGADRGTVYRFDGELIHIAAQAGYSEEQMALYRRIFPLAASMQTALGKSVLTRRTVHVEDTLTERRYTSDTEAIRVAREVLGYRTVLAVPMVHRDQALGIISVTRREQLPFSPKQIALVETFADQAVIAVENVRLFNETKEALEQQTATAEILRVISSSPTDYQPVFDAIVRTAGLVCGAVDALLWTTDGDELVVRAHHGPLPATIGARQPMHGSVAGYAVHQARVVHVKDLTEADDFPVGRDLARRLGWRTTLSAPLLGEGVAIGAILIRRSEVRPFSDQQIALLQTFADQAVIAIENVRLFTELQASNRELTTALGTQTATSDILSVISRSQTNVQPVFDAIVDSAARLLRGYTSVLTRIKGDLIELGAFTSIDDAGDAAVKARYARPLQSDDPHAQALRDRAPLNIADADTDPRLPESARDFTRVRGYRSWVVVPMLRHDEAIGTIAVTRRDPGGFGDDEIALLRTFADQAVIAIENARLLSELQERNEALTQANAQVTEALEQQTATAEILRVISSSPTDVQPVFDTIVRSAVRLCNGLFSVLYQFDGELIHQVAQHNLTAEALEATHRVFPARPSRALRTGRAILERAVVHIPDVERDPEYHHQAVDRAAGWRSGLFVPMLRESAPIGVIAVARAETGPFSDNEIALLKTFADQAVIAIENVRLFKELEEKNRALAESHAQVTEALEQQTATSEVLKVISRSTFELEPVLETLIENATRLCGADRGQVYKADGEVLRSATAYGLAPEVGDYLEQRPLPIGPTSMAGRAALERRTIYSSDVLAETWFQPPDDRHKILGLRTVLAVPMLRGEAVVGVFTIWKTIVEPFTDRQIELVTTFADQAVIAIENVRLFKELEARTRELTHSVEELRALGEVSQAVSSTLELETVLATIVTRAVQISGSYEGIVYEFDEATQTFHARATYQITPEHLEALRRTPVRLGEGAVGRAGVIHEPVQVADIEAEWQLVAPQVRTLHAREGMRSLLAVPLVREDRLFGGLVILRRDRGAFPPEAVATLRTLAAQSVLAIQNARLFREIADKSQQLEAASRHKSEFLANMSHELRTPLNAIIGFSEVLVDRMFGELTEKQDEYLKDIYASGQHLLSLINDILDLSKIEAGRMELEATDFDLPSAIDNALILVRERATRRGITLGHSVDERLGSIRGDERKVKQVLLNLLSNALKFTPEGGRIDVSAAVHDEVAEVSVTDTGVGIAPEDQEAVFEEFRQVGTADKKVEGTGLGLALSRKFIELHGGRIWVKSQVGHGSTFTFTLPVRREE